MSQQRAPGRVLVVANRLPFAFRETDGALKPEPSSGGLVRAMVPVLRGRGGVWIGWAGVHGPRRGVQPQLDALALEEGYALRAVPLEAAEVQGFYQGFSNEIVWPLFHDLQSLCNFDPAYWRTYREVNRKFAAGALEVAERDDFVWVHDYHLMNVGAELRAGGCASRIGFFLHIPFPNVDLYSKLPWRSELIEALLAYDVLGFQTLRDRRNFLDCVRALDPHAHIEGKGRVATVHAGKRRVAVGAFPISIDYNAFAREAAAPSVAERAQQLHQLLPKRRIVLGIDRLDYTKGIPERLKAFQSLLSRYPEMRERMSLIQVVVPSRTDVPQYASLKLEIEQLVARINGEFSKPGGWVPVWYEYGSLTHEELLAYYRAADIALITPLRDGMNLVAKEYCVCSIEEECVLILSEFAGAAAQLAGGALLVNPHDVEQVADTLKRAYDMAPQERAARMRRMRRSIRRQDVFWWLESFMAEASPRARAALPAQALRALAASPE